MGLFDRSADKLSERTTLLLAADPGDMLMDAARLYDPNVRPWHGRLVFRNGVLLFGPVPVTPKLEQQAGLPVGMAVAYYTGAAAVQTSREKRSHEAKHSDGDELVHGLADRLGGTVKYAGPPPDLTLTPAVYGEQAVPPDQVIEVLRPYSGDLRREDLTENSYFLSGEGTYFHATYWSPRLYLEPYAPPALGALRSRPLHHWDLHMGADRKSIAGEPLGSELIGRVGDAAFALAGRCGGVVIDEFGFPVNSTHDLFPC